MVSSLKVKMLTILLAPAVLLIAMLSFYAYYTADSALSGEVMELPGTGRGISARSLINQSSSRNPYLPM